VPVPHLGHEPVRIIVLIMFLLDYLSIFTVSVELFSKESSSNNTRILFEKLS